MTFFKRQCFRRIRMVVGNNQTLTHTHTREEETFELFDLPQPGERKFPLDKYTRYRYVSSCQ